MLLNIIYFRPPSGNVCDSINNNNKKLMFYYTHFFRLPPIMCQTVTGLNRGVQFIWILANTAEQF